VTNLDLTTLNLSEIAYLIAEDWGDKVNYAADPYLNAMFAVKDLDSPYGADNGKTIVLYFLSNAATWRGDTAKAVKAELKRRLGR
jgi:hypothetical protein